MEHYERPKCTSQARSHESAGTQHTHRRGSADPYFSPAHELPWTDRPMDAVWRNGRAVCVCGSL